MQILHLITDLWWIFHHIGILILRQRKLHQQLMTADLDVTEQKRDMQYLLNSSLVLCMLTEMYYQHLMLKHLQETGHGMTWLSLSRILQLRSHQMVWLIMDVVTTTDLIHTMELLLSRQFRVSSVLTEHSLTLQHGLKVSSSLQNLNRVDISHLRHRHLTWKAGWVTSMHGVELQAM